MALEGTDPGEAPTGRRAQVGRIFQRQGYDSATALSSGAIASAASWAAKGVLLLAAIGFGAGTFHAPAGSGGSHTAIWIVVGVMLAAGIAAALITLIPRLRRPGHPRRMRHGIPGQQDHEHDFFGRPVSSNARKVHACGVIFMAFSF